MLPHKSVMGFFVVFFCNACPGVLAFIRKHILQPMCEPNVCIKCNQIEEKE